MNWTAAILTIGNEVLAGSVEEINANHITRELRALGVALREVRFVPDEVPVIARAIQELASAHEVVFSTGGVGPTHDDVTLEAVARAFNQNIVRNEEMARALRDVYGKRINEISLRMADLPEEAELDWGVDGQLRVPVVKVRNLYVLPGEPTIFKRKFEAIKERFRSTPFLVKRFFTTRGEEDIAELLTRLQRDFPKLNVGSYPVYGGKDYAVMVCIEGKDRGAFEDAVNRLSGALPLNSIVRIE